MSGEERKDGRKEHNDATDDASNDTDDQRDIVATQRGFKSDPDLASPAVV